MPLNSNTNANADAIEVKLRDLGALPDKDVPLSDTALQMSAYMHPGLSIDRYQEHLKILRNGVAQRFHDLLMAGAEDTVGTRLAALKHVIADEFKYEGDKDHYNDLQNADLVRVIERRKGLPIALAILTLDAAQAQNWDIEGLNFPGHFLLRLSHQGHIVIFDPFNAFNILEAPDLRALIKSMAGPEAELSATYYEPASNRDILLRLQNNIKHRQIEGEDYTAALQTVEMMRWIAPADYRLLFDAGVLYAKTNHIAQAIDSLEEYLTKTPHAADKYDAQLFLQSLKDSLN